MRTAAIVLWVLGVGFAIFTLFFTADISTSDGMTVTHRVGWGEGMERLGPAFYGLAVVSIICGTIFWVGHLLDRRRS